MVGAEPYKCDNAKLVRECNDLHLTFLQYREQNEATQKGEYLSELSDILFKNRMCMKTTALYEVVR